MRRGISRALFFVGLGLLVVSAALFVSYSFGMAAPDLQTVSATPTPETSSNPTFQGNIVANTVCLSCHGQPGLTKTLGNGDILDLTVTAETYATSIHDQQGYACVQCHVAYMEIPHSTRNFEDLRQVTLELNEESCQRCHSGEYEHAQDSVHATALAGGNRAAAVCSDCHTAHATRLLTDPSTGEVSGDARLHIPQTCSQCHFAIYEVYLTSVHGAALEDENNTDVPTCIDCHGVHNITDPRTNTFRLSSPQLCASCHTDPEIMDKYGISTQVLSTYVADFHGTTVTLFEQQSPDAETNKPVCYDCHGVHDIARPSDPERGLLVRENLLTRCQVCHPDATDNFPDAWLSHYIPDPDKTPFVYYVNLFYKFFIPGVLGGMGVLVVLDLSKLILTRTTSLRKHHTAPTDDASKHEIMMDTSSTISIPEHAPPDESETISDAPPSEIISVDALPEADVSDESLIDPATLAEEDEINTPPTVDDVEDDEQGDAEVTND